MIPTLLRILNRSSMQFVKPNMKHTATNAVCGILRLDKKPVALETLV